MVPTGIVVHWRHFRDLDAVTKANADLDPLNPHGITGVIHEHEEKRNEPRMDADGRG